MSTQKNIHTKVIEFYQDVKKEWRARIRSSNGKIIFSTSEGFKKIDGAKKNIKAIAKALFYVTDDLHEPIVYTYQEPKKA